MARFLGVRLLSGLVVIVGVSIFIFVIARIVPGDPARLALGPEASAEQVEAMRIQMGFDRPLAEQYLNFVVGALRFDFGRSLYTDNPVAMDVAKTFPATLELVLYAGIGMTLIGGAMGIASAHFKDRWPDNAARVFSLLAVAMPNFVWAIFMMLLLAFWAQILPLTGRLSESLAPPAAITGLYTIDAVLQGQWRVFADALAHLILPATALALPGLAQISRLTRTNMVDSYDRPFVEFSRAYGLSERSVALKWALRPAIIPTLMIMGMQIVALLGNAFIVETIFIWPGMAKYGVNAILRKDLNAMVAVVMLISVFFVLVNMLIDTVVSFIDPKIRLKTK
ncbi:ABC transporter permease [Celeribacter indicus]|uniref:Binding-protein-dependent transport system inner membrane protein n=1 Tax=Celeribacter indicus TaxID=1208324 RepID=A0A0B5E3T0_9RHOB|nr:ABC transporter permease [Celeribacter indicus]AJE47052.1 binding-protein-dependent transport system inner membrane protein [Celeribacter indicus]SDW92077.1 peptide/nickel transport system permease protein [Celeribacter indicus]